MGVPKIRGTLFWGLVIRILLSGALYWGPLFLETPIYGERAVISIRPGPS